MGFFNFWNVVALMAMAILVNHRNARDESDFMSAELYYARGNMHRAKGDYDVALRDYEKAIELDSKYRDDHSVLMAYVTKAVQDKDYTTARLYYERVLARDSDNLAMLEYILSLDVWLVDKPTARERALRILRLDPNHERANYIMGSLNVEEQNFDSAIEHLKRAIATHPATYSLNDLAYAYLRKGEMAEAMKHAQEGLKIDENHYVLLDTYGEILVAEKRFDEAEKAFERSIQLMTKTDFRVHVHLAGLYVTKGEMENARKLFSTIIPNAASLSGKEVSQFKELHLKLLGEEWSAPE